MGLFGGRMSNVVEWVENSEDIIFINGLSHS